jgi:hypothetical protein
MRSDTLLTISFSDIPILLFNIHKEMDKMQSTNFFFGTLLTKLVNENKTDWDEHLSIVLFSYQTTYKVGTGHTPFSAGIWVTSIITYRIPKNMYHY